MSWNLIILAVYRLFCKADGIEHFSQRENDAYEACLNHPVSCDEGFKAFNEQNESKLNARALSNDDGTIYRSLSKEYGLENYVDDCIAAIDSNSHANSILYDVLMCQAFASVPPFSTCKGCPSEGIVEIGMSMKFMKNLGIQASNGNLNFVVWLRFFWNDPRLAYHGSDYFEDWDPFVDSVSVYTGPDGIIWYPDVTLLNGVYSNIDEVSNWSFKAQVYDSKFLDSYGWNVFWSRMLVLKTRCTVNYERFPFDTQLCTFVFAPWTWAYRTELFIIFAGFPNVVEVGYSDSLTSENFELTNDNIMVFHTTNASRSCTSSGATLLCKPEVEKVAYVLRMRRLPHYFNINLIWPLTTMMFFSYLTFWLPFRVYDRVCLTVMVLFTVFSIMSVLVADRPPYEFQTWLDDFISGTTILCMLPAFETILLTRASDIVSRHKEMVIDNHYYIDPIVSPLAFDSSSEEVEEEAPTRSDRCSSQTDFRLSVGSASNISLRERESDFKTSMKKSDTSMSIISREKIKERRKLYQAHTDNRGIFLTEFHDFDNLFNQIVMTVSTQRKWTQFIDSILCVMILETRGIVIRSSILG
eukprot:GHVH01011178.1.p1 GENE.GHVH01011178.1~~GHVH01011178.1.p1  ORF type:complete len:583 (+),score=69.50 GHVH01011178.1:52-1800(+)